MKPIEERLWDFIDGTCNAEEKLSVEKLLQADPAMKQLYEEFLSLSSNLKAMELDEPSMRFTQNVMDLVALEPAPRALQTKVDKRIIYGIGSFFVITLTALLGYALSQIDFNTSRFDLSFQMPVIEWSKYFGPAFMQGSLIAIVILSLITVDRVMQYRKNMSAPK